MGREERDEFVLCTSFEFEKYNSSSRYALYRAISRFKKIGGPKYILISYVHSCALFVTSFVYSCTQDQERQCGIESHLC